MRCKAEVYMYTSENPAQCELEEGHQLPHRVVVDEGVFLWPMPKSPTPFDIICAAFASLLEAENGQGVDDWCREEVEGTAKALEEINRPVAAKRLRDNWATHHR